jgi:hypothetical protein
MAYRVTEIDELFPVAGVDNESQGFRDNFSAIKDSLAQSKTDIELLQSTRLDVTDPTSDLANNTIENVNLKAVSFEYNDGGNIIADSNVSFVNGSLQLFTVSKNNLVLTFIDWPELGRVGNIKLHLVNGTTTTTAGSFIVGRKYTIVEVGTTDWNVVAGTSALTYEVGDQVTIVNAGTGDGVARLVRTVEFNSESNGTMYHSTTVPATIEISDTVNPLVLEAWTYDGGVNVFLNYFGKFTAV